MTYFPQIMFCLYIHQHFSGLHVHINYTHFCNVWTSYAKITCVQCVWAIGLNVCSFMEIIEDNLIHIVTTHARHVGMCHIVQNLPHIVFVLVHEGWAGTMFQFPSFNLRLFMCANYFLICWISSPYHTFYLHVLDKSFVNQNMHTLSDLWWTVYVLQNI